MVFPVAQRLTGLVQSDIRRMTRECNRVGGINLGQGICDLPTPPVICDRALQAIQSGKNTYSFPAGIFELQEAIALKLKHHNNIVVDPLEEIVVTLGVSGGFIATITRDLYPGKS